MSLAARLPPSMFGELRWLILELPLNANKALWEKGDFTKIAETMRESGEAFVAGLGIESGMNVLDVGCGDGTTALPAAKRGAVVLGVDIAANLVEAGMNRARAARLNNLRFEEGDASNLERLPDSKFDLVISVFGAMFAPRPFDVAKELVRVTRPRGRIVMGNWIPGDPTLVAQILKISANYTPPPPDGFVSPMTWGDEAEVRKRFYCAGIKPQDISFTRETWHFRQPRTPSELFATFRDFYGPTMNAFEAAKRQNLSQELEEKLLSLFINQNEHAVGTSIPATYLKVSIVKS